MATTPFWEPPQTLAKLAHGTSDAIAPRTNWGSPMKRDGTREYSIGVTRLNATFTEKDVRIISGLTLDPQLFNPSICALFRQLMLALPGARRPQGAVQETWINELLCLLPACSHDHTRYESAGQCAAEYVELGIAPLLLPLYTAMLRSDFWPRQVDRQVRGRTAHNGWHSGHSDGPPVQLLQDDGYSLNELAGDPAGIVYPYGKRWSTDFMDAREALFSGSYHVNGRAGESVQDSLFTLDVMAQVVATTDRGLNDRMDSYNRWTAQI